MSRPTLSAAAPPSGVDQSRGPEPAHATPYSIRKVARRFAGYLTGDTLNYFVGFCIYGWLIRVLSNVHYGQLSVITSIYQVLMMVTALGIDLIGPRLISNASEDVGRTIAMLEKLRIAAALFFCLPITLVIALMYYQRSGIVFAELMLASFAMIFARALDLSYVAVAYGLPRHLAKSRLIGLALYLLALVLAAPLLGGHLWLIPILNAGGITIGRLQLKRWLHLHLSLRTGTRPSLTWSTTVLKAGLKAGAGQLILLSFQNLDIVYLARYAPAAVVGQYAMISRLCVLGTAVLASTFFAFMPDMLHASANPTEFRKTFKRFFLVSAIFGIAGFLGFVFLAGSVAELFAKRPLPVTDQIAPYFGITYLFIAAGAPFYNVLAAFRRERSYLFSICSGAVALLITDLLLVPHYAAKGAAIGQAVAALVILVTSSVLLLRKEILRNPPKFDTAMFAASGPQ